MTYAGRIGSIGAMALSCLSMIGCAAQHAFPPHVMEKVVPTFDFTAWREAPPSNPAGASDAGHKVILGGHIVHVDRKGDGTLIIAEHAPLSNGQVSHASSAASRNADREFAFLYPGQLESGLLKPGSPVVLVGTTKGRIPVFLDGRSTTEPYLVADCIELWKPDTKQLVYCAPKK